MLGDMSNKTYRVVLCVLIISALLIAIPRNSKAAGNLAYLKLTKRYNDGGTLLDLDKGTVVNIPYLYSQMQSLGSTDSDESRPSPDGRHVAYMHVNDVQKPDILLDQQIGTFYIASIDFFGNVGKPRIIRRNLPQPFLGGGTWAGNMDFGWSPDGKWLIYHWRDVLGTDGLGDVVTGTDYIDIADADAHELFAKPLAFNAKVQFDEWSGDYLSGLIGDRIAFFSLPDLHYSLARPQGITRLRSTCYSDAENVNNYCSVWSPNGRFVAYGALYPGKKERFVISRPGISAAVAVFDLPPDQTYSGAIWAPDSQHLALYSIFPSKDEQQRSPQMGIDVLGLDGSRYHVTDTSTIELEGDGGGPPFTLFNWCNNSTLVYSDISTNPPQIMRFDLRNQQQFVVPGNVPSPNPFDHEPSPLNSLDCQHELYQWSDINTDYAGIVDVTTGEKVALIDQKADSLTWQANKWAVAQWDMSIAWAKPDGSGKHQIDTTNGLTVLDWSADGNWMLYARNNAGETEIMLVDLNTGSYHPVWSLEKYGATAVFAPDSRSAVLTIDTEAALVTIPDGKAVRIDHAATPTKIIWSPDNQYFVLYTDAQKTLDVYQRDGTHLKHFENVPGFDSISWFDR